MNDDQLLAFLTVARTRSLSRAAEELGLGQPTISDRLHALQRALGVTLVRRQGRGVGLTPEGEAFLPYAQRALEVMKQGAESARAVRTGASGRVSVAVTVTAGAYLFAPALVAFQSAQPEVEVQVRSAHSWESTGLLLDNVAHLALTSGALVHPQLETVAEFRGRLVLAARTDHPLAQSMQVTKSDLANAQLLVSYWGPAYRRFLEEVKAAGAPRRWLELSPVELVKGLLLAGVGVSVVPEVAVKEEIGDRRLVTLTLADAKLPDWHIALSRRAHRAANPAADALAEVLVEMLPDLAR
ncbi:MAG TPA: LysR family transcriptional regulator [Anaerolineae bacterium]|nr:LysR family transcriptional regulator [Anaerolineae bacterium]